DLQREFVLDLIVDAARDAYASRVGDRLDARRDVDSVPQQIATLDDDVAQVDADAKPHARGLRQMLVACTQRGLNFRRAPNSLHRGRKLCEDRVACGVERAAPVRLQELVEDFAMTPKDLDGTLLVFTHHPAVSEYVGHEDRREPAFDR